MEMEMEEIQGRDLDLDLKDVWTMKRFVRECFCSRLFDYESQFPLVLGTNDSSEFLDYEWEELVPNNNNDDNYTDSLCSTFKALDTPSAGSIDKGIYVRVLLAISLLGLAGNITSFIVLVVIGAQSSATGRIKRVARHGLMALAVSDAIVCLTAVPVGLVDHFPISMTFDFSTVHAAYGEAVMSIFITSSTWITVTMAAARYFAICSPFRARDAIRGANAKRCVTAIAFFSLISNIPRFWWRTIETADCDDHLFYFTWYGPLGLESDSPAGKVYFWVYSTAVIFCPLVLLVLSSVCLVRKLRQTTSIRHDAGTGLAPTCQYISSRDVQITVTLITIATVHVVLVSPAEVLSFLRIVDGDLQAIFNTMQVSNFTINFLLYAILNRSFRRALVDLLRCRLVRWQLVKRDSGGGGGGGGGAGNQRHRLLTLQSYVNVNEMVNNNTTLPADDVINTCL